MAAMTLAEELLSCVSPYSYAHLIAYLTTHDFVSLQRFPKTNVSKLFTLDRSYCLENGEVKNNHLFELFGHYSLESAESVRSDALERINCGAHRYEQVGADFLEVCGIMFREWALSACNQYYYGDKLVLYVLCRIFHRHAFVVCNDHVWTTIDSDIPLTINKLLDVCDLKLVFFRPGIFGKLKLKKKHGQLNPLIVEHSPPEFPTWTDTAQGAFFTVTYISDLSCTTDRMEQKVNIKQEEQPQQDPTSVSLRAATTSVESVNNMDTPQIMSIKSEPLTSGNTSDTKQYHTLDVPPVVPLRDVNITSNGSDPVLDVPSVEDIWNDSLIIANEFGTPVENPISLTSLKMSCTQKMLESFHVYTPLSLMQLCCDQISWEPGVQYPCSIRLLSNMLCAGYVAELQRIKYCNTKPIEKAAKVTLFDHIKVNAVVREYWIKEVNRRCYSMSLPKLSEEESEHWSGSKEVSESWRNIDAY